MFAEMELTQATELLPALVQKAVNTNPGLLNSTDSQIAAMLKKAGLTSPGDFVGFRRRNTSMSDLAPLLTPIGLRASQKALLDSFANSAQISPVQWRTDTSVYIVPAGLADTLSQIGGAFLGFGAMAWGAAEIMGELALGAAAISTGFGLGLVCGALAIVAYEAYSAN